MAGWNPVFVEKLLLILHGFKLLAYEPSCRKGESSSGQESGGRSRGLALVKTNKKNRFRKVRGIATN